MTGNIPDLPALAKICREWGALLYVDDAHGFGVIGERGDGSPTPYGTRGNAVVRHCAETYDDVVLVGGFSKAYSALLAFVAVPTALKERLKLAAPPYLYSGPSPVHSLAAVLAGFDVNEARGEQLRHTLHRLTARVLAHLRSLGAHTPTGTRHRSSSCRCHPATTWPTWPACSGGAACTSRSPRTRWCPGVRSVSGCS
ncbi:aminotransferase class I/II-fold pyridoxal phosphate-dependent enzyme [Catellatospora coxensis]